MNHILQLPTDEWARVRRAANFSGISVEDFVKDWIIAGVRACEDDYITHQREVVGDKLETEELAREVLL